MLIVAISTVSFFSLGWILLGANDAPQKTDPVALAKGKVLYLNAGDWIEHLTALEYYEKDWHIYQYDPNKMKTLTIKELMPKPDVMTNEIAFYLHSLGA